MTREELINILELHKKYLDNDGGERANLRNANLRGADLSYTALHGANLRNADLRYADLGGANLRYADLSNANLSNANLSGVNLFGANLSGADLRNANLWSVVGNMMHVKSLQIEKYTIVYTSNIIQIGCKNHSIEEWKNFDDETINKMDDGALEWWKKWKETLFKIIEMSPAEPTMKDNK